MMMRDSMSIEQAERLFDQLPENSICTPEEAKAKTTEEALNAEWRLSFLFRWGIRLAALAVGFALVMATGGF